MPLIPIVHDYLPLANYSNHKLYNFTIKYLMWTGIMVMHKCMPTSYIYVSGKKLRKQN